MHDNSCEVRKLAVNFYVRVYYATTPSVLPKSYKDGKAYKTNYAGRCCGPNEIDRSNTRPQRY